MMSLVMDLKPYLPGEDMEPISVFDILLAFVGMFALTFSTGGWFRRQTRRSLGTILMLFLGVGSLASAALDVGLSEWDKTRRPLDDDGEFIGFSQATLPVGSPAPDFALPSLDDGRMIRLGDFRGRKPVLLMLGSFT